MTLALVSSRRNARLRAQTSIFTVENKYFLVQVAPQASWPPSLPADCLQARRPQPGILSLGSSGRNPQPRVLEGSLKGSFEGCLPLRVPLRAPLRVPLRVSLRIPLRGIDLFVFTFSIFRRSVSSKFSHFLVSVYFFGHTPVSLVSSSAPAAVAPPLQPAQTWPSSDTAVSSGQSATSKLFSPVDQSKCEIC